MGFEDLHFAGWGYGSLVGFCLLGIKLSASIL
jgi:hypothetical protein